MNEIELPAIPDRIRTFAEGTDLEAIEAYAQQAVLAERQRCAQVCDAVYAEEQREPVCNGFARECAEKIRGG